MAAAKPKVPAGMGKAGAALWRDLVALYEFSAPELRVLEQTCRCLDAIGALDRQVAADGTMVDGSKGQQVLHPAIGEARQQRQTLARLLTTLDLPDEDGNPVVASPLRQRGKAGAAARWSRGA